MIDETVAGGFEPLTCIVRVPPAFKLPDVGDRRVRWGPQAPCSNPRRLPRIAGIFRVTQPKRTRARERETQSYWSCSACLSLRLARIASRSETGRRVSDSRTDNVNCTHVLRFDRAAVLSNLLVDAGLFPAHAPGGPPLASAKPDLLISRLRQPIHIAADLHVRLEGPAVQLIPEMLAQRRLANLKLSTVPIHSTKGRAREER